MAKIDENLQKILKAVYGEEVRGAIHDSIQEMNGIVISHEETIKAAEVATNNANEATTKANEAASSATSAANSANSAASLANTNASAAETAASNANRAAQDTAEATTKANQAAGLANTNASAAETAASNANRAAQTATSEATKASTNASAAETAAQTANSAAASALEAAKKAEEAAGGTFHVDTAKRLETGRQLGVSLTTVFGSSSEAVFDGSKNVLNIPVSGRLSIPYGGTGADTKSGARANLGITSGTELPSEATGYSEGDIFLLYTT